MLSRCSWVRGGSSILHGRCHRIRPELPECVRGHRELRVHTLVFCIRCCLHRRDRRLGHSWCFSSNVHRRACATRRDWTRPPAAAGQRLHSRCHRIRSTYQSTCEGIGAVGKPCAAVALGLGVAAPYCTVGAIGFGQTYQRAECVQGHRELCVH